MKRKLFCMCITVSVSFFVNAQHTLKLSLPEAEKLFLQNNYQLLLAKYEIEQAKADVITAKLFDNPEIAYDNLFYNQETKRFFETSYQTGQYAAQISQLFKMAGKRNKNINLANTAAKMEAYQYFDLMRTLHYQLTSSFYQLYYKQQSAQIFDRQIKGLQQLLKASEKQLAMGNMAGKDVIRIKSLLYGLQTDYRAILNQAEEISNDLKLLTKIAPSTNIQTELSEENKSLLNHITYTAMLDSAKINRADLKGAQTAVVYAQQNLKLQKANAIPDINLNVSYDLKGNYPDKYTGIGIRMPIPLFNRNQGEIKKAKIGVQANQLAYQQLENGLENEVFAAYKNAQRVEDLWLNIDPNFNQDYQKLIDEVSKNFAKKNISLLEFLDFYESYKNNTIQFNQLQFERMDAKEKINFVTGTHLFK